ncbi:glycosyltransferase [Corynebacterium sp. CCUG 61414]|uniref:glycosyltransferase n=1 Tax=Corynebacterium sp. CCUG 61414 TaxID=2823896 RepID=UPI00210EE463|nr:glycosyltransferase [Corynebacterium sp. CCUG 61414]MCQ4610358.1 glycosyltransferase [Corynebacterium sp. CCUG 61414]
MPVIPMLMSGSLSSKLSGVTRSALARARYFDELGFAEPVVLVHAFHAAFDREIEKLRATGELSSGTKVRSLYTDLARLRDDKSGSTDPGARLDLDGFREVKDSEKESISRYYDVDGNYRAYANWGDGSFVPVVNLINGGKKYKTLWIRQNNSVIRARLFSSDGKVLEDQYFNEQGQIYLSVTYLNGEIDFFRAFDRNGTERAFVDLDALIAYWLVTCNEDILRNNCLISEWTYQIKAVQEAKVQLNFRDIYVFHGSHILTTSPRYQDYIVPFYQETVEKIPSMSSCVVLTKQQKFDLQKRQPTLSNISVIPHVMEIPEQKLSAREPGLVVSVSQLREVKGIAKFVPFFARVIEKCTGIVEPRFEIYGSGPEHDKIARVIKEHSLEQYVTLKGTVPNSGGVYSSAQVAVFPSQREGQPLSLFESIAHGCVPVAFDFKYGARSGIEDGENGFVVDLDNYAELADAVALLLIDNRLRMNMSEACMEKNGEYRPNDFVQLWRQLFEELGVN